MNDSATPAEREEFAALMRLPENELLARQFLHRAFREPKQPADVTEETAATILQAIFSADETKQETIPASGRTARQIVPHRRRWMVAAAAAVVVLSAGGLYRYRTHAVPPLTVTAKKEIRFDAPPGHAGALLTLADGSQITLDSARNGTLSQQGNTRLLKQGGLVSYKNETGTEAAILYNTMSTGRGRNYQLILSDGTKVWLNAASSIRFPTAFTGKERRVIITGEAYFEVTANKSMPFIVVAGNTMINVLGTHFDVMDYNDENNSNTTLIEGSVKIIHGARQVLLTPGRQASIERATGEISDQTVDVDPVIAWTKGQLSLDNLDLPALMRQISRWYDVDVTFQGKIPDLHIGGLIDRDVYLSTVLGFLEANGMHYKIEGKTITILP